MAMILKTRALVVEDNLLLAEAICDLLHDQGLDPIGPVARASTAFEFSSRNAFDIAVVNVLLGAGNAFEFANYLLRRNVPFLLLTGFSQDLLPAALRTVPLVPKPFEIASLNAAVRALLGQGACVSKKQLLHPAWPLQGVGFAAVEERTVPKT